VCEGRFDEDISGDGKVILGDVRAEAAGGLGESHFQSRTFFVEVHVRRDIEKKTVKLVVKFVTPTEKHNKLKVVDEIAKNEGRMYNSILPYFSEIWKKKCGEKLTIYPKLV